MSATRSILSETTLRRARLCALTAKLKHRGQYEEVPTGHDMMTSGSVFSSFLAWKDIPLKGRFEIASEAKWPPGLRGLPRLDCCCGLGG